MDFKTAAAFANTVILAVNWKGVENAIALSGGKDAFKGKLAIDATNPITSIDSTYSCVYSHDVNKTSGGEIVQKWLPDSKVVKCWNMIHYTAMINPLDYGGVKPDMIIASDHKDALASVKEILVKTGWPAKNIHMYVFAWLHCLEVHAHVYLTEGLVACEQQGGLKCCTLRTLPVG